MVNGDAIAVSRELVRVYMASISKYTVDVTAVGSEISYRKCNGGSGIDSAMSTGRQSNCQRQGLAESLLY